MGNNTHAQIHAQYKNVTFNMQDLAACFAPIKMLDRTSPLRGSKMGKPHKSPLYVIIWSRVQTGLDAKTTRVVRGAGCMLPRPELEQELVFLQVS
jgi:hypothetical protein